MTPWQKRARLLMAVVALGVIASVIYTLRPRETVAPAAPLERLDPNSKIETRGGDVIQLKGARQDLKIEFLGQITYPDGQTALRDVKVYADNRGGRNYVITGKEARVGKDESSFDIKGDVKLETSDGLVVMTEQANYSDAEKIVKAPGPAKFSRGRMNGSGVGFTFDEQRDVLWILDQAVVHFAPDAANGPMDVTAGAFGYARRDRYMRFEKTMHMDRDGQQIDASEATVRLFPDRDETDMLELRGDAKVTGGKAMGALRSMSSRDMNLDYAEDGRTLQHATLAGGADIQLATKDGSGGQRLQGELMDIGLEPDGSVRSLSARERVVVSLPATKETAARTIRSNVLTANGNAQGLRDMQFREGVEYREAATKSQGARVARAQSLDASLEAATGALVEAKFTGGFEFTDGPMRATSPESTYRLTAGILSLGGATGRPHMEDGTLTIDANAIDITLSPRKLSATGRVGSTMQPAAKPRGNAPAARRPGLLTEKDPVQIVAEKLAYDEATRKAEYSGAARLIQGDTHINAETITLDETRGDLIANGKVVTNLQITEQDGPGDKTVKPKPMIARAGSFTYSDQQRLATYSTAAQLDGDQGNLSAAKIDLHLAKDDNTLERLEANGQVTAIVDKRTVTGTRLSYSPADAKYVVIGAPVKMIDADCQETSGKTLTFYKASDRVQVDGNNEVRTQTKGGGKCPATPPQ